MEADIVILGEFLAEYIQNILGSGVVHSEFDYDFEEDLGTFDGMNITVMPLRYGQGEPVTRIEDSYDLVLGLIIRERYKPPASGTKAIPKEWVNEKLAFVEQQLFNPLSDSRTMFEVPGSGGDQYWCQFAEVVVAYRWQFLKQDKVFWSEVELTYRKLKR